MANRINSAFTIEDTLLAYSVGDNGLALASSDGGATWRRLTLPHSGNLYTVSFPGQGAIGYACGDGLLTANYSLPASAARPVSASR